MNVVDMFNEDRILDLSFFNFRNAITAAFFADRDLKVLKVNENFRKFFPTLGSVTDVYFPNILAQLGISEEQVKEFKTGVHENGSVLIPEVRITIGDEERMFSLLSTRTSDPVFPYLNGVQGQFVDRTEQWRLRREREQLVAEKLQDKEIIDEKSRRLEDLATRLARYLSPQIYESIFHGQQDGTAPTSRKNLTVFFSDIEAFAELSDRLDPEKVATLINAYLSEMSVIALECGGTIDKFIGDAMLVFFGDPETLGDEEDALRAVEMGVRMQQRIAELQGLWKKNGAPEGLKVRMAIATGFCTVGKFGSEHRLEYTALGGPVNLASRLQLIAPTGTVLIAESTHALVNQHVNCKPFERVTPKGFARPIQVYEVEDFKDAEHRDRRRRLSHLGKHVEVNVINSTDIRAAIEELRSIQQDFEERFRDP